MQQTPLAGLIKTVSADAPAAQGAAGSGRASRRRAAQARGIASSSAASPAKRAKPSAAAPSDAIAARGQSFVSILQRVVTTADTVKSSPTREVKASRRPEAAAVTTKRAAARAKTMAGSEAEAPAESGAAAPAAAEIAVNASSGRQSPGARSPASRSSRSAGSGGLPRAAEPGRSAGGVSAAPAARIVVADLRTTGTPGSGSVQHRSPSRKTRAAEAGTGTGDHSSATRSPVVVVTSRSTERSGDSPALSLRSSPDMPAQAPRTGEKTQAQQAPPGRFSEILRDEVVRHASVVVRDGGQGEIRLLLKPESLGEVRIRMKVVDDSIEGTIVVRSSEVGDLFRDNIETLETALRDQGFQSARLDVSVSDGGRDRPRTEEPVPVAAPAVAAEEIERSSKIVVLTDAGMHAVNLVA